MKRRTKPVQKSGTSPYVKKQKTAYPYPGWVRDKRQPIPAEIEAQLARRK